VGGDAMPIPESQLETWSHQGAVTTSSATYASIKRAVSASDSGYADKDVAVFLQGSYANDTNIRGDSDVDVVVELASVFRHSLGQLPPEQVRAFHAAYDNATYQFSDFKQAVVEQLQSVYEARTVQVGHKSTKLLAGSGRLGADIVVCQQYRDYHWFYDISNQGYDEGIIFPTAYGQDVINYPLQHSENCTKKHQATSQWFKPTVRIFKNIRSVLADRGVLSKETAPSYFVEGLLYNVPDGQFGGSYVDTVCNCFNWIRRANRSQFLCPNGKSLLFGPLSVQWSPEKCDEFLRCIEEMWRLW